MVSERICLFYLLNTANELYTFRSITGYNIYNAGHSKEFAGNSFHRIASSRYKQGSVLLFLSLMQWNLWEIQNKSKNLAALTYTLYHNRTVLIALNQPHLRYTNIMRNYYKNNCRYFIFVSNVTYHILVFGGLYRLRQKKTFFLAD